MTQFEAFATALASAFMDSQYLTARQAAAVLHLSRRQVLAYCKSGRLPAVKFGNAYLIDPLELERFAAVPRPRGGWRPRKVKQ